MDKVELLSTDYNVHMVRQAREKPEDVQAVAVRKPNQLQQPIKFVQLSMDIRYTVDYAPNSSSGSYSLMLNNAKSSHETREDPGQNFNSRP